MLGGAIFAACNVAVGPIVRVIGLGVGTLIWSSVQCVVGWAIGTFGIYGLLRGKPVKNAPLNYAGVTIILIRYKQTLYHIIVKKTLR